MQTAKFQVMMFLIILYLYCVQAVHVFNGTDICKHGSNETGPPTLSGDNETTDISKEIQMYSSVNQTWTIYSNPEANLTPLFYKRQENGNPMKINEAFGLTIKSEQISKCTLVTLKIPNVTENHFGKYCFAMKNDMGRLPMTLLLRPLGTPLPPRDFKVDCYPVAQFAKVYWKSGSYDRLNTKFNVYYRQRYERHWTAAHTNIFGKSTNVKVFGKLRYFVERFTYIEKLKRGSYEFRLSSIKLGEENFSLETKVCNITGKDNQGNKASVNSRISVSVSFLLSLLHFLISY